jgi:hypothetical protein
VGATVMTLDAGGGTRTANMFTVTFDGDGNVGVLDVNCTNTGSGSLIDIDIDGIHTGDAINVTYGTAASTGNAIKIDMGTAVAGTAIVLAASGSRTDDLIQIDDASTGNSAIFDINLSAAYTGTVLDIACGNTTVAATPIKISRGTGTNTAPSIDIDDAGATSAAQIDIDITGANTGNAIDITYGTGASTGDAISITTDTNLEGSALVITAAGTRTDDTIKLEIDDAGSSHVIDANVSAAGSGNFLDITYATDAHTGNAIDLNMGTNVAGMALSINSAATGTNDEGAAIDIVHSGNLVEGATVLRIDSTGSPAAATGNIVELIQRTGAGTSGNYLLYMSATGTNVEALKVDDGAVVFDETLTVTGACTFSSTVTYKHKTEVVTAANVINASESGSVYFLKANDEFASTLPAPAAGLHFTFIVSQAPADVNYTITTTDSANIIIGMVNASTGGDEDSETSGCDTINFVAGTSTVGDKVEVFCDGTNWFAYGICDATGAITLTTAG